MLCGLVHCNVGLVASSTGALMWHCDGIIGWFSCVVATIDVDLRLLGYCTTVYEKTWPVVTPQGTMAP